MNERIKSLLNVCGMPNEDLMDIYGDKNKSFYMQQFAELIIEECSKLIDSAEDAVVIYSTKTGERISKGNMLRQYFGVK